MVLGSREVLFEDAFGGGLQFRQAELLVGPHLDVQGLFDASARGLVEMLPQWEQPYLVDDSAFCERFRVHATTLEAGVAQMIAAGRDDAHHEKRNTIGSAALTPRA